MAVVGNGGGPMTDAANPRARAYAMFRLSQAMKQGTIGLRQFEQMSQHPQQSYRQLSGAMATMPHQNPMDLVNPQNGPQQNPQMDVAKQQALQAAMQHMLPGGMNMGGGPQSDMGDYSYAGPMQDQLGRMQNGAAGHAGLDPAAMMQKIRAMQMIRQRMQGMGGGMGGDTGGMGRGPQY